jgi:hypothetical protein
MLRPTRSGRRLAAVFLWVAATGCTFDSTTEGPIPVLGRVVIHDPAPTDANCEQRARQMMWMVHLYDAEATDRFLGLPSRVSSNVTTANGNACEYTTVILVRIPNHMPTMQWFVLAMDEAQWITECSTPLLTVTEPDQLIVPVGPIRFVRGQSGCTVGGQ